MVLAGAHRKTTKRNPVSGTLRDENKADAGMRGLVSIIETVPYLSDIKRRKSSRCPLFDGVF